MSQTRVVKPSAPLFGSHKPTPEPSKPRGQKAPTSPVDKPSGARMAEVTVKLPEALIEKLDRLRKRQSTGLTSVGRSTFLRWLLEQHAE